MVDLVKIRKKAREKKERDAAAAASALPSSSRSSEPVEPSRSAALSPVKSKESTKPEVEQSQIEPQPVSRLDRFKQDVLARQARAAAIADVEVASETSSDQMEILTFMIGTEQFALPVSDIAEIMEPREITRVPNARPDVLGIISVRGTIVTILDVSSRLGHREARQSSDSRFLIVEEIAGRSGFIVDRIGRVTSVSSSETRQEPALISAEQSGRIRGVFRREGELIMLLNVDRVLQDEN
ncbi:MAG: chemotaxis protein CheW [Acidobacteriota bacterium]